MPRYFLLVCLLFLMSCKKETKENEVVERQEIEVVDFDGLQALLEKKNEKIYVVNFWATWCKPCIEELPFFEEVNDSLNKKDLEVVLVSLDFPKQIETQLYPFLEKNNIKSRVVLLDDPHENDWIPKVDSTWSGAIPATLILKGEKSAFYEKSFTRESLFNELSKFINI